MSDRQATVEIAAHPLLRIAAFVARFPQPLGEIASPEGIRVRLKLEASAPLSRSEENRTATRDLLRWGGYKPTGRGKPASEYLVRAAEEKSLDSINAAVDCCNVVSLHSGIPISVVDLDLVRPPFRIAIAPRESSYVFNPTGQEIDLSGLVCLFDLEGPCANAVRDSQRTKTSLKTSSTLSILWGVSGQEDRLRLADQWYRELLKEVGASIETVNLYQASTA